MPDFEGSDHCPVKATMTWECVASKKCPPLCSKFLPEFTGKQQKLSSYFSVGTKASERHPEPKKSSSDGEFRISSSQDSSDSWSGSHSANFSQHKSSEKLGASFGGLKRSSSGQASNMSSSKKLKPEDKKPSGGKQGNLLSFFGKGKPVEAKETAGSDESKSSKSDPSKVAPTVSEKNSGSSPSEKHSHQNSKHSETVSSWKSLLKGPPAAPLCEGHKEPCLLRTVKKDSLNKGRQFWVCCRPEGHKSNKEARCEHFEWVVKKPQQPK